MVLSKGSDASRLVPVGRRRFRLASLRLRIHMEPNYKVQNGAVSFAPCCTARDIWAPGHGPACKWYSVQSTVPVHILLSSPRDVIFNTQRYLLDPAGYARAGIRQQGQREGEKQSSRQQFIPNTLMMDSAVTVRNTTNYLVGILVYLRGANNTIFTYSEYHPGEARRPMNAMARKASPCFYHTKTKQWPR